MKKLLLLFLLCSPTFGQSIADFGSSLELKNRDVKEIQVNAKQYVAENPKPFWWSMGIINQIEAGVLLTSGEGSAVYPWNVTILDFKLGKTPALYFYGQARFGSIIGKVVNTTIGDTTSFNAGALVGMGGKVAEMYTTIGNKDSALISAYVNGGFLFKTSRFEQWTNIPYLGYEVNTYFVYESSFASAMLGASIGLDVVSSDHKDALAAQLRLGLQFGFMF